MAKIVFPTPRLLITVFLFWKMKWLIFSRKIISIKCSKKNGLLFGRKRDKIVKELFRTIAAARFVIPLRMILRMRTSFVISVIYSFMWIVSLLREARRKNIFVISVKLLENVVNILNVSFVHKEEELWLRLPSKLIMSSLKRTLRLIMSSIRNVGDWKMIIL